MEIFTAKHAFSLSVLRDWKKRDICIYQCSGRMRWWSSGDCFNSVVFNLTACVFVCDKDYCINFHSSRSLQIAFLVSLSKKLPTISTLTDQVPSSFNYTIGLFLLEPNLLQPMSLSPLLSASISLSLIFWTSLTTLSRTFFPHVCPLLRPDEPKRRAQKANQCSTNPVMKHCVLLVGAK